MLPRVSSQRISMLMANYLSVETTRLLDNQMKGYFVTIFENRETKKRQ